MLLLLIIMMSCMDRINTAKYVLLVKIHLLCIEGDTTAVYADKCSAIPVHPSILMAS